MGHQFASIAFTPAVKKLQEQHHSRENYRDIERGADYNHHLGEQERDFIAARDSFYMATVSESGWPYVQHRGGPPGFMRVLDAQTLGFADFRGNRQYVSAGNLYKEDRVSLFFMDYTQRRRLKILGRVQVVEKDDKARLSALEVDSYRAHVERGFIITIAAFDWNCPMHITPRYSEAELELRVAELREENQHLRNQLKVSVKPLV